MTFSRTKETPPGGRRISIPLSELCHASHKLIVYKHHAVRYTACCSCGAYATRRVQKLAFPCAMANEDMWKMKTGETRGKKTRTLEDEVKQAERRTRVRQRRARGPSGAGHLRVLEQSRTTHCQGDALRNKKWCNQIQWHVQCFSVSSPRLARSEG